MSSPSPTATIATPIIEADVAIEDDRWGTHPDLEAAIHAAVAALARATEIASRGAGLATVMLSDDARVMALNTNFRHKPTPTNVLSFPAGDGATAPGEPLYLGDIILARETIEREAREQAIPLFHHVQHLTIHGFLHLLGYDHETDDDAAVMEQLETRVLTTLGIANPYDTG